MTKVFFSNPRVKTFPKFNSCYAQYTRALVGRWAMAHPIFENLVNKGVFYKTFSKNFTSGGPPTFKMPTRALQYTVIYTGPPKGLPM